jgi:chitodextrinase
MDNQNEHNNIVVGGQKAPSGFWANKRLMATIFIVVFAAIGGIMLFRTFASNPSISVFSSNAVPKTIDSGDGQAVELGVKFKSDSAGTISGVRFYKSALNTGTHVGSLWSSTGTLLATATFTNESSSGWQQVSFGQPVQIEANTVYTASYHTSSGHYSDDQGGLGRLITTGPLHLIADGTNGPNGVYAYGTASSFPSNGWQSSNYYVDVVFTPATSTTGGGTSTGPGASTGAITVEQQVATHQSSPGTTITSPTFSTTKSGELLTTFLTSDGPGNKAQSFKSVSGGGLTWTLKARSNQKAGTSEIWQATAGSPLSNVQVTAKRANGSYAGSMVVTAFVGADTASGATATNSATGAPTVSLTTQRNSSWVWAVGNDYDKPISRTVGPGQTKVDEYMPPVGDTYWVQRQNAVTATSGTKVTINDTAPTTDQYNLAAIEILPLPATGTGGGTVNVSPPSVPTNLSAAALSASQIKLSWSASTPASGTTLTGYNVYRNGSIITTTQGTTYTDSSLSPGTAYEYKVSANASNNTSSGISNSASATTQASVDTTAPSVPSGVKATATNASTVAITWAASTDNVGVTKYLVLRDGNVLGTSTAISYTDTTSAANTTYSYQVEAQDAAGNTSASSTAVSIKTPNPADTTAPSVPKGLIASAVSSSQVNLSWSASTDNVAVAGYNVYRNGNKIGTTTTTSFGDATLNANTAYSYTVSAYDGAGNTSSQTAAASTTTLASNPTNTGSSCVGAANTPGGADPWGGCFPGPTNTGVPASLLVNCQLHTPENCLPVVNSTHAVSSGDSSLASDNTGWSYSVSDGYITVTAQNAVIDAISGPGIYVPAGRSLLVKNSKIGIINHQGSSLDVESTEIDGGNQWTYSNVQGGSNITVRNSNLHSGQHGILCYGNCTAENNWIHDNADGSAAGSHQNGFLSVNGATFTLTHNSIGCVGGCTADIAFLAQSDNSDATVNKNLLLTSPMAAYCVYPGPNKSTANAKNMVWTNNVFQRGTNNKCATYGPVYGWYPQVGPGNVWSGNVWDDGSALTPS